MKTKNLYFILVGFLVVFPFLVAITSRIEFSLSLLNNFFLMGSFYVIIGSFLFIFEKGFFNGILYSIKRFRRSTKKGKFSSKYDHVDEIGEIFEEHQQNRKFLITIPFLYIGGLSVIGSIIVTFLFYT